VTIRSSPGFFERRRLEGTEPTTCTGRDNLVTLAVVKAAYRSADIV
jgi:hypothetical protein